MRMVPLAKTPPAAAGRLRRSSRTACATMRAWSSSHAACKLRLARQQRSQLVPHKRLAQSKRVRPSRKMALTRQAVKDLEALQSRAQR
jgi:hypothetical protein